MNKLEFIQKKFNVKSEKDLTESQLIEYARSKEAGALTNLSIESVFIAMKSHEKDKKSQPDMKRVFECLRQAIREDAVFNFGMNAHENPERWWYYVR